MSKKLDIIGLYLGEYTQSFAGREIARRLAVSPQAALAVLNELVQEKILLSSWEGRNRKYRLNKDNLSSQLFLALAETQQALVRLDNAELKAVLESIISEAESVIVFGSFAGGQQSEDSDLDLVIINAPHKEKIRKILHTFPREIQTEFVSWSEFTEAYRKTKALALEIKKKHLLYGNVFKVVQKYCT